MNFRRPMQPVKLLHPPRKALHEPAANDGGQPPYEWSGILDQLEQGVFLHDAERRILRCNAAYARLAGQPMQAIVGRPYWQVFPKLPAPPDEAARQNAEVNQGERTWEFTTPAGQVFQTRETTARTASGGFWYCCHVLVDVTARKRAEQAAARERAIADAILDTASLALFLVDAEGRLVRWNRAVRDNTGLSDAELQGRDGLAFVAPEDRALAEAKLLTALAAGHAEAELKIQTPQGVRTYLNTARRVMVDGKPHVAGFGMDITERTRTEASLTKENEFSAALLRSMPGAVFVLDQEGNFVRWNGYVNQMTGRGNAELTGSSALLMVGEEDRPAAAAVLRDAFETGAGQATVGIPTADRGLRRFLLTLRRFDFDHDGMFFAGIGVDNTEHIDRIGQLEHKANTDPLTGVINRGRFVDLATNEFARSRRYGHALSVWIVDIDHFKAVNDGYGHQAGDTVLRALVDTLQQTLRDWDILGRIGGEEFAVLLPETGTEQAMLVGERLRQRVSTSAVAVSAEHAVRVTVSMGVATMRADDGDVHAVLARADQALYDAKTTGRDKVCREKTCGAGAP